MQKIDVILYGLICKKRFLKGFQDYKFEINQVFS